MPADRFRAAVAVYGLVRSDGGVLLMRRAGSGYHDGELSLPAGHIEGGEDVVTALIRELAEELMIMVEPGDCRLRVVAHRAPEPPGDHEYVDLFFDIAGWRSEPSIGEPNKCSELVWAPPTDLPDDVIPYVSRAILAIESGETLVLEGWPALRLS